MCRALKQGLRARMCILEKCSLIQYKYEIGIGVPDAVPVRAYEHTRMLVLVQHLVILLIAGYIFP